jgi:hypothetical protein
MITTHTPGPWEAVGNLVRTRRRPDGRGGLLVAECPANVGQRIEDARLIACAPDLLLELQAAHRIIANALPLLDAGQKDSWARSNARDGVDGEGITRANERLAVLHRATGGAA